MIIRKTEEKDLARLMELYARAREFMAKNGNPNQWGLTNWPPKDLICDDIKTGRSYVCVNDEERVVGTFVYVYGEDIEPTYQVISDGQWIGDNTYGIIHRLASDGSERGIGAFCINWALNQDEHLRIDTHQDNVIMQRLLQKLGFSHCGTIFIGDNRDSDSRLAYEKLI